MSINKIPISFIDKHTRYCKECEKRRSFMNRVYLLEIPPTEWHLGEWDARDKMLDELLLECEKCYIESVKELQNKTL